MRACPAGARRRRCLTQDESLGPTQLEQSESHVEMCPSCQDVLDRLSDDEVPSGTTLPDLSLHGYRVYKLLGAGRFGEVWLAQDLNLPRVVALKTLRVGAAANAQARELEAPRQDAAL